MAKVIEINTSTVINKWPIYVINANSNQNYFQFHESHYKYEKGEPLGMPISRNFYRIGRYRISWPIRRTFFPRKM